jgi:hypothetical protein
MDALAARSNRRKTILKVSQSSLQNGSPAWRLVFTRVRMQTLRITAVVALIAAGTIASFGTMAQAPGIKRADLLRNDLSVAGREVVQVLVEIAPGWSLPSIPIPAKKSLTWSKVRWSMRSRADPRHAEGWRGVVHPLWSTARGDECRQRHCVRIGHIHCRKGKAPFHAD